MCLRSRLWRRPELLRLGDESVYPSIESIIRRLVKVGARVLCHARKWYVHIASAFSIARYYQILFA